MNMDDLTSDFMNKLTDETMKKFITELLKNDTMVLDKFNKILMQCNVSGNDTPLQNLLKLFNSDAFTQDVRQSQNIEVFRGYATKRIVKAINTEYYKIFYQNLFTENFREQLVDLLQSQLHGNVLHKSCGVTGSKPFFGKKTTTKTCCQNVCDKMISLDKALDDLFKEYSNDDSVKYHDFSLKDFGISDFYMDSKNTNPGNYVKECIDDKHIDLNLLDTCKNSADNLKKFLPVLPSNKERLVVGGYSNTKRRSKNKYRHASKKSRKSRPRRRSLRNKKRHTKRHTKRYINRK